MSLRRASVALALGLAACSTDIVRPDDGGGGSDLAAPATPSDLAVPMPVLDLANADIAIAADATDGSSADGTVIADAAGPTADLYCLGPPQIATLPINPTSLCAGSTVAVPFQMDGCVDPANTFAAQLSDPTGSFNTFVNIGTLKSTGSGVIQALIPMNTAPAARYRIRVVALSPYAPGGDNGADIAVNSVPDSGFKFSPQYAETGAPVLFKPNSLAGAQYAWKLGSGAMPATSTAAQPTVTYSTEGIKIVGLTVTSAEGCSSHTESDSFVGRGALGVYSCNPVIPPNATVIVGMANLAMGPVWICAGGNLTSPAMFINEPAFVEGGGQFDFTNGVTQFTVYVKAGGSFVASNFNDETLAVYEPGASVSGMRLPRAQCPKLTFDKRMAPKNGCP